jgi:EAL domain-containing protein (putative c-di-GMP-specific phosphodiesterase class I)
MGWSARHPQRPVELSVNVSARQLMALGLRPDRSGDAGGDRDGPARPGPGAHRGSLPGRPLTGRWSCSQDLKGLGVRLALDDFGTGYCSLGYLRQFPIDIVKIDQSFVSGLHQDPVATKIATAVAELAHVLDMTVTAEGVEQAEQRQNVLEIGCEQAQGYWFAEPMTSREVDAALGTDPAAPLLLPRATAERELVGVVAFDR